VAAEHGETFGTTHWSVIAAASGPDRRRALERLYKAYWTPLCGYARRHAVPEDEVEDVVQEFVIGLFESDALRRADPQLGRFRSYLLGALRNFLLRRVTRQMTQKRGGGRDALPLDHADEIAEPLPEVEKLFDQEWAEALFSLGLSRLSEETYRQEFATIDRQWEQLIFGFNETPYPELAAQWGISVSGLKTRVFRLRRRFREILREEVSRTVSDDLEVDDEMRYLCAVLGAQWA
jgi:RNA polymerase sigma-70 factor (ECF subfamily)